MNTPFIPSGFLPVHSVSCCKIILALSITISSLLLLSGCTKQNATSEGEILTEPVTQSEEITTQASDALAFADENTDYPYTDITDDIITFTDAINELSYATPSEQTAASATALAQAFYDLTPELTAEERSVPNLPNATISEEGWHILSFLPAREYYECPLGITLPAQDAVNQAAAIVKGAFAPDCTIENAYVYYHNSFPYQPEGEHRWTVFLITTLSDGSHCTFLLEIDAISGILRSALYLYDKELVPEKIYDPITKDNYEAYAAATLDYLLAAGVAVDESIEPIVTRYMTISYYAIVYTTTTGEHYQAFLYTDGTCCYITHCGYWASQSERIVAPEDMENYEIDWSSVFAPTPTSE